MNITQARLKELFKYNKRNGYFTRIKSVGAGKKGCVVGVVSHGYLYVTIDGQKYPLHRLAFLYVEGEFPEHDVDHANGIKSDNRWTNIEHSTKRQNMMNRGIDKRNKSGFNGVNWCGRTGNWRVRIGVDGRDVNIGRFDALEVAIKARKKANIKYGFHENHGLRR